MYFQAGCKINLNLHITGRDNQGYHLLRSIFFPSAKPSDELEITINETGNFQLKCDTLFPGPNILEKAWINFCETIGSRIGVFIKLAKKIPVGAGLGGGSSDAALLLRCLNRAIANSLPEKNLLELAKSIGADVPFFLYNKPAHISGTGENIAPLRCWPEFYALVIWPGIAISTREIFREWDKHNDGKNALPLTKSSHMDKKNCSREIFDNLCNDLEPCAIGLYPELAKLKRDILGTGALAAVMSGSGSSFFGIYESPGTAKKAFCQLSAYYTNIFLNHFAASRE